MKLRTSEEVKRYSWDELPMPDVVIERVNRLGKDQPKELIFMDRDGRPIGDVESTGVDGDLNDHEPQIKIESEDVEENELDIKQEQEQLDILMDTGEPNQVSTEGIDPT